MMPTRASIGACTATAAIILAATACREDVAEAPGNQDTPGRSAAQGVAGFFDPQPGESWTYSVTRDFAPGTRFSSRENATAIELPNGARRTTFERRRICAGTEQPNGAEKKLTAFTLYEGDRLVEREFYDITSAGLIARGWTPAPESTPTINPPATGLLLNPGVKIALPGMSGGQSWTAPGAGSGPIFQLDVIERTMVTVPAGEFDASRIRLTSTSAKRATKRTVWFAENVGIVKEEIIRYGTERILAKEELVLTKWTLPGDDPPAPDPVPAETDAMEDSPPAPGSPPTEGGEPESEPEPEEASPTTDTPTTGDSPDPSGESDDPEPSGDESGDPMDDTTDDSGETTAPPPATEGAVDRADDDQDDPPPAKEEASPPKALIIEE